MTLKNKLFSFRTLSLCLAVLLLLSVSCSAFAETITVRIPSKLGNLALPDLPEPLGLDTWTDSIATYGNPKDPSQPKTPNDPCPILAVSDAVMHLQFSEQPDFAIASWYNGKEVIDVGPDGYAELYTEGKKIQAGFGWTGRQTKEKEWFIQAGKDGVTAGYSNSGDVRYIEYTFDGDFFGTGIEGAQTTVRYEPVTIDGDYYIYKIDQRTGKRVKENQKGLIADPDSPDGIKHWYYTNWYIPTITTVYPKSSGLAKIVANYWNTEKAALKHISIPQNQSDVDELYSSGYDDASITAHYESYLADIVREYQLMTEMKGHTNVVNCDDIRYVQKDSGIGWDIYIKMELLNPMTKALDRTIEEKQVIKLGRDMASALVLCRKRNILHRDIKPQNIFVSKAGDFTLGDFASPRRWRRPAAAPRSAPTATWRRRCTTTSPTATRRTSTPWAWCCTGS